MRLIRTDADLQNCIYFDQEVEVWVQGELDMVGRVVRYTEDTVQMHDGYYLRGNASLKLELR